MSDVEIVAKAIWGVWDCPEEDNERLEVYAKAAITAYKSTPELRKLVEAAEDFRQQVLAVHGPTPRVSFSALDAALEPFQKEE